MSVAILPRCTQCHGDLVLMDVFRCGHCGKPVDTGGLSPAEWFNNGAHPVEPVYVENFVDTTNLKAEDVMIEDKATTGETASPVPADNLLDLNPLPEKPLFKAHPKTGKLIPV